MPWLYQQSGSRYWWIGYRRGGRQILKSTGKTDRQEAEQVLATIDTMIKAERSGRLTDSFYEFITGRHVPVVTIKAAIEQWHNAHAQSRAAKTAERYEDVTGQFLAYLKADDAHPLLRDVSGVDVTGFLNHSAKQLSRGSIIVTRKILSAFWNWCMRQTPKLATENPVHGTPIPKVRKDDVVKRRPFTRTELLAIWRVTKDPFWRYMNHGGLYTGLRIGDLIRLAKDDVDFRAGKLEVTTLKTGMVVEIPLALPFRKILEPLVRRTRGKYLWPRQRKLYNRPRIGAGPFSNDFYEKVLAPAGLVPKRSHAATAASNGRRKKHRLSEISFHSYRHTFVSLLKLSNVPQSVVKALAAHATDEVSELYTHVGFDNLELGIKQLPEITV